jgi:hypothetical protein
VAVTVSQDGQLNGSQAYAEAELISRPATIKELLAGTKAGVLFGVHNALGAKIAEEAGADGLWMSSFELHAAHRLPDADILGTEDYVSVIRIPSAPAAAYAFVRSSATSMPRSLISASVRATTAKLSSVRFSRQASIFPQKVLVSSSSSCMPS